MVLDWLYTPRSGSKLFATSSGVCIATTSFASHVIACEAIIEVNTATPNAYWRWAGHDLLEQIVAVMGGAAADERGRLIYYAPRREAAVAASLLLSDLARSARDVPSAEKLLWRASLLWGTLIPPYMVHEQARIAAEQAAIRSLSDEEWSQWNAAVNAAADEWERRRDARRREE